RAELCDAGQTTPSRGKRGWQGGSLHLEKSFKKSIDTDTRNFLSHADAPKTDREFYPVTSLFVWGPINTKQINNRERKNTQSMYPLNQLKSLVSCGRDPARSLPLRRGFLLIPLMLVCFALSPQTQAIPQPNTPDPGAKPVSDTADGQNSLLSITSGIHNSGFGFDALLSNSDASFSTAVGSAALLVSNAPENVGVGCGALLLNVAPRNTACGTFALFNNSGDPDPTVGSGVFKVAVGANSMFLNTTGASNNAVGESSMFNNTTGSANTAVGDVALASGAGDDNSFNTALGANALFGGDGMISNSNNAVGADALQSIVGDATGLGGFNNAMGVDALSALVNGQGNVAVGDSAGASVEGNFNIYIGFAVDPGVNEDNTIRIGDTLDAACFIGGIFGQSSGGGDPVLCGSDGKLGTAPAGSPLSMKEMLKQRQIVQELKTTTERQAAVIALQEGQIQTLTAALKQQADQIQKVSAQLEMIRPTPRVVENR